MFIEQQHISLKIIKYSVVGPGALKNLLLLSCTPLENSFVQDVLKQKKNLAYL